MNKIDYKDADQLQTLISTDYSNWSQPITVTQELINDFAELSGDKLWIHVDVERCKTQSPLKSTIAHGFLVLSLLTKMPAENNILEKVSGYRQVFNYGSNKLRFMAPVLAGSQIHSRHRVSKIEVSDSKTLVALESQVSVVGCKDKPSLLYELLIALA